MGSQTINNDSKGNQLNKDGKTYYWDKLNRLVEIRNSSNVQVAGYYYNTDNLRVEKITSAGTEQYYCGARVCVETNGSQAVTKEYIHGGQYIDEIITIITGGTPYFYLYDLRYNMYAMVDDLANIIERARYEGYGKQELMDTSFNLISSPLVDQPYSYTGQILDSESGLQYYRARYFDNNMGRFISRDPLGYIAGLNLYGGSFVPSMVDPRGLHPDQFENTSQCDCLLTEFIVTANLLKTDPCGVGNRLVSTSKNTTTGNKTDYDFTCWKCTNQGDQCPSPKKCKFKSTGTKWTCWCQN